MPKNPIAIRKFVKAHESSVLRSPRDSDATPRVWQRGQTTQSQVASLCNAVELLQRQLDRLRRRKGGSDGGTGMIYKGQWSAGVQYSAQDMVTRWNLGEFVAVATPTIGDPPETDASTWHAFVVQPPGIWA